MGIITGELDPATGVRWLNSEGPATCCQMTKVITVVTHDVLGGVRVPANMPAFVEPAEVGVAAETEATDATDADKVVEATYPRMPSTQIRAKLTHSDRLPPPWYMSHHDVAVLPWSPVDGVDDVLSGDVDLAYIGHASGLRSFGDKTLALAPYCRTQLYLWAEKTNPLAYKQSLAPKDLNGRTILIPANAKRKSWLLCLEAFQERTGAKIRVEERYCDSIEDLIMSKANHDDLMLCDENSLKFAAYRLREHHIALPFNPPYHAAISMGYDAKTSNMALLHLVEFLEAKMPAT